MTGKADFTDEEWAQLERAPFVAGLAITFADPGGPIEAVKESMASLKTVTAAAQSGDNGDLVHEIAKSAVEKAQNRQNPIGDFKPRGAMAGNEIIEDLRASNALVSEKATPEEAAAFREWLLSSAKEAANAAKEGGFLGFKAERVSEGEQKMLDKLGEVLT
jgi:hypothetical protein